MIDLALKVALGAVLVSLWMCMLRLWRGPDACDRLLALDTLCVNVVALVIVLGLVLQNQVYFEAALMLALLGFIATVALARFLTRGRVVE